MEPLQRKQENKYDLMEIAGVLLGNFWLILAVGIFAALCGLFYTKAAVTPTYTSSTKLYVLSKADGTSPVTSSDLQLSAALAGDYADLIRDRTVTESVISELELSLKAEQLANMISVSMPDSGRMIQISVTDTDPYRACKLVTAVRDTAAVHIKEVMGLEEVNVVAEANIPQGGSLYNYKKNGLMAAFLGMAAVIGIILFQYMLNDTIKGEDDVKRYLDMSVLGVIPLSASQKKKRGKRRRKGSKESEGMWA